MNYYEMLNRVAFQNAMAKRAYIEDQFGVGAGTGLGKAYGDYTKGIEEQNKAITKDEDKIKAKSYGDWAKDNKEYVKTYNDITSGARMRSYIGGGATMAGVTGLAGLAGNQIPWLRNRKFLKWLLAGGIGLASALPVAHYVGKAEAQSALDKDENKAKLDEAKKKDADEAAKNSGGK